MKTIHTSIKTTLLVLIAMSFTAAFARADSYSWTNFQSDIAGVAQHVDPNLVNPWGMAASSGGTIWVSDNGTGVSTLYHQDGTAVSLVVTIPTAARNREGGNPTGVVFNSTSFFNVTLNGNSQPARFIFVSEDGSISGWNPALDQTHAIIAVDNGTNRGINRAIYKGATLGVANGHNFLYATNFHTGHVETYDESFHQVNPGGFADPGLPAGYGPFGIRNFNGEIFVTYAKQDHDREDDVPGPGFGFVNVFDTRTKNTGYSASSPKIKPLLRSNVVVCRLRTTTISFAKESAPITGRGAEAEDSSAYQFVVFPSRRNAEHEIAE